MNYSFYPKIIITVVSKHKPFILFLNSRDERSKKLGEAFQEAGLGVHDFEKDSLAFKFLEKNNVSGIFMTCDTFEKARVQMGEVQKNQSRAALFCTLNQCSAENIAELLDLGCDEIFAKSISTVEVIARVKAVLRRYLGSKNLLLSNNISLDTTKFSFHGVTINPGQLEIVFSEKNKIKLGKKELGIIYYLAYNPGVIISRRSLIQAVWGPHADTRSRSVDQYITKIRVLFEKHADGLSCLRTLHGIGYWYDPKLLSKKKASS